MVRRHCSPSLIGVGRCAFRPPRVVFILGLVSLKADFVGPFASADFRRAQARLAAHAGRGAAAPWPPPGRFRASTA